MCSLLGGLFFAALAVGIAVQLLWFGVEANGGQAQADLLALDTAFQLHRGARASTDLGVTPVPESERVFFAELTYRWTRRTIIRVLHTYAQCIRLDPDNVFGLQSAHAFWLQFQRHFIAHHIKAAYGHWFADIVRVVSGVVNAARSSGEYSSSSGSTNGRSSPSAARSADEFVRWYESNGRKFQTDLEHMLHALSKHFAAAINEQHSSTQRAKNLVEMSEYFARAERECEAHFEEEWKKVNAVTREWLSLPAQRAIFNRMSRAAQTQNVRCFLSRPLLLLLTGLCV